jgi:hypothetical protein
MRKMSLKAVRVCVCACVCVSAASQTSDRGKTRAGNIRAPGFFSPGTRETGNEALGGGCLLYIQHIFPLMLEELQKR